MREAAGGGVGAERPWKPGRVEPAPASTAETPPLDPSCPGGNLFAKFSVVADAAPLWRHAAEDLARFAAQASCITPLRHTPSAHTILIGGSCSSCPEARTMATAGELVCGVPLAGDGGGGPRCCGGGAVHMDCAGPTGGAGCHRRGTPTALSDWSRPARHRTRSDVSQGGRRSRCPGCQTGESVATQHCSGATMLTRFDMSL